jgi:rhodanese-related sulfurtransferase
MNCSPGPQLCCRTGPPRSRPSTQANGALFLVDIRGDDQRRDGLIPGAIVIPRNCLEWRCDPTSECRHPVIAHHDLHIILICHEGYQSSLAAATLQQLGMIHVTDLDGGFTAWAAADLPVIGPRALRTAVPGVTGCYLGRRSAAPRIQGRTA